MFHFDFYETVFLNAADTAFIEVKKKKKIRTNIHGTTSAKIYLDGFLPFSVKSCK